MYAIRSYYGEGRGPVGEGTGLFDGEGNQVGSITSGTFGPSAEQPVAMGYVSSASICLRGLMRLIMSSALRPV